jgi:Predicted RNA binding protein (contains ribosomal protein S1 domain)
MNHSAIGDILEGTIVRVYPKYAIMLFDGGETGLLHISELSNSFVRNFTGYVQVGNIYKVKVIAYDESKSFMKVSLKQLTSEEKREPLTKKRVELKDVDFTELEKRLPDWIKQENNKE